MVTNISEVYTAHILRQSLLPCSWRQVPFKQWETLMKLYDVITLKNYTEDPGREEL
jgi:hypothetical protein